MNLIRRSGEPSVWTHELHPIRWLKEHVWKHPGSAQSAWPEEPGAFWPRFDVKESKSEIIVKADLPGLAERDLEVSLTGNRLVVRGERTFETHEESDTFYRSERAYGSFVRSFTLPEAVDPEGVRANLSKGVLTVSLPKRELEQSRRIQLRNGT